jgi:hypothetical protein
MKMKNTRSDLLVFAVTLAVAMSLFNCATSPKPSAGGPEEIPLPKNINIVAPPADLPREIAAFSGKWTGKWDAVLNSVLIVEEINDKEAKVILAQGNYPPWPVEAGYRRIIARVIFSSKPSIEFEVKRIDQPVVTFEMQKDLNTIKGFWVYICRPDDRTAENAYTCQDSAKEDSRQISRITMKRAK